MRPVRHEQGVQELLVPIEGVVTRLEVHVQPIPGSGCQCLGRDDDVVVRRLPLDGGAVDPDVSDSGGRVLEVQDQVVHRRTGPIEVRHERALERCPERPRHPHTVGVVEVRQGPGAHLGQRPGHPVIETEHRRYIPPARDVRGEGRRPNGQDTQASRTSHGTYSGEIQGASHAGSRPASYSSRKAVTIGSRAARMAGKRPPNSPITRAYAAPCMSSAGVTVKAKATWLKVCQFIVAV